MRSVLSGVEIVGAPERELEVHTPFSGPVRVDGRVELLQHWMVIRAKRSEAMSAVIALVFTLSNLHWGFARNLRLDPQVQLGQTSAQRHS